VSPGARWLALATPVVAMVAVGVGLEVGARGGVRAAVVQGAPMSRAGTGLAWQLVASEEEHGMREPLAHADVKVVGRAGGASATWQGTTDGDGVAEVRLDLPTSVGVTLEVTSGATLLAQGEVSPEPPRPEPPAGGAWAPFAKREGALELDVSVLGQRVAPGFPASVWVRARDAATHAPVAGAEIEPQTDPSLTQVTASARTDSRGWAEIVATPVGLAIGLELVARAPDGRKGAWLGGLFASPGAARIATRARWSPQEPVEIEVVAPSTRSAAYVEIDDAHGRAWATAIPLGASSGGAPGGVARGPKLAPGLYWAVAAGDAVGASELGAGTSTRPFFVADSDEQALRSGEDVEACAPPRDVRESGRALSTCLALAVARPVPRWPALDGFDAQRARSAERRARGLGIALGAIATAVLLEVALLLRAAAEARMQAIEGTLPTAGRRWTLAVALLTALLGFALLAAFLARLG
jgi:hypothetical protein